jgi:hypothetical protein
VTSISKEGRRRRNEENYSKHVREGEKHSETERIKTHEIESDSAKDGVDLINAAKNENIFFPVCLKCR